jgi:outer membrane protein OmpA-like peptidoglycan-associated protein
MDLLRKSILMSALALLLVSGADAQFNDQGLGFGGSFGGTFAQTELRDKKPDFLVRAFLRYGILSNLQGEFGVGTGYIKGVLYRTNIFPVDYRLVYSPLSFERINPYVYAGAGVLRYDVEKVPPDAPANSEYRGWAPFIPAGAGIQFLTTENVAWELQGGYNHTFSDKLNQVETGVDDAYWTFSAGITVIGEGGTADRDGDGLTKDEEEALGTDRKNADTDGDGLSDGAEVKTYNTNPLKADSDGDGLSDSQELNTYRTDPNKADTDGDGINDGQEVTKTMTDPLKADTDGDGLSDGQEVNTYKTDPLKVDTDGDGLSDADELNRYKTNPLSVDTDSGTVRDDVEIARGTNPLDITDDVKPEIKVEVGAAIILDGVMFETGKAEITAVSDSVLQQAYNTLFQNPDITVEIRGYTDNAGQKKKNLKLSQDRADAVKAWLVNKGINEARIASVGFGSENPIAPNTTKDGKAKNRRIEFYRTK